MLSQATQPTFLLSSKYLFDKQEHGELRGVISTQYNDNWTICDAIDMTSDFCERSMTEFLMVLEERFTKIGFLTKIHVLDDHQGQGHGKRFMESFMEQTKGVECRFLLARVGNKQRNGFDLRGFYESFGFAPLAVSDGDMLMVSKEHAEDFKNDLGWHWF